MLLKIIQKRYDKNFSGDISYIIKNIYYRRGMDMNRKICNFIFFILCFSLIFNNIPKIIQLNFLGGPIGSKLTIYPLLAGVIYSVFCHYKYRDVFVDTKWVSRYIMVFISVEALSTVIGLVTYPYYDLVLNGPVDQIEKLPKVLNFLSLHGIYADEKLLMQAWIIIRQLKGIIVETFWCFGGAYMIYCWYKNNWHEALHIMILGISASFIVLFFYASIEIPYLAGNSVATNILKAVNPYIHPISTDHGWWPPLLWKGQLRLIFSEPSHVGNFIAFGLPIIWYMYFSLTGWSKNFAIIVHILMSFLIFTTKARTAWAMLAGMIVLLLCLIIWGKRYALLKKYAILIFGLGIGFLGYIQFEHYTSHVSTLNNDNVAVQAVQNNLMSLASSNKRSNGARYALLKAHFRTGMEHPFLGVGRGLASAYVHDHFTAEESENMEVAKWIRDEDEHGPMASGYSIPNALNEFVSRFSSTGVLGVVIFFFPFAYVTICLLRKWRKNSELTAMFITLALISSVVAGCNGNINVFYSVWLLLGIDYAIVFSDTKKGNA